MQTISPKHRSTPAEFSEKTRALVTEDQFCRFPSLQCFQDGPLHIDPLWRLFVIPWTITVKPRAALFPMLRSSQRGFRHTISHGYSTIGDAVVSDLHSPNQHPVYLQTLSITSSVPLFEKDRTKFGYKLPNNYYFQSSDVMWLSLIIHLLHYVTLVTEMLLWSQRSNHDRRLNKRQKISFIP